MDINDTFAFSQTVQLYKPPTGLVGLSLVPENAYDADSARWDQITFSRGVAPFTSDDAPATTKPKVGRILKTAAFGHCKLSNTLNSGDLLARVPGTVNQVDPNAHVLRESSNLNTILEKTKELSIWKMFSGTFASTDIQAAAEGVIFSVDYGITNTHKPTAAVTWATSTTDIVGDVKTWKLLAQKDGGLPIIQAIVNSKTMGYMLNNTSVQNLLGQAAFREQVGKTGAINTFLGIEWKVYDDFYTNPAGTTTAFVPDDRLIMLPAITAEVAEVISGHSMVPSGDALSKVIGKYAYSYTSKNPAGQSVVVGQKFLPVLKQPNAVIYADVTT